jgi:LPXTG-motif cell wall-anchored protein
LRTTIRRLAAAAAGAVFALTAIAVTAAPSVATGGNECAGIKHSDTKPFVNRNAADTANTNGTFTLTANGVKIVTPDNDAKVYGYFELTPALPLTGIQAAGFSNINGSGLLPSYQFGLSVNGAWGGTLAWESTYQPAGYQNPTDVLHSGNSKWYITKDHPGYTHHTVKTWDELVALLPEGSSAIYYGINQGAGGIATNTVNNVKLKTKTWCKNHTWTDYVSPSASASASASVKPSTSATATHATPTSSAAPSLPVTGVNAGGVALLGGGLAAAGAGLFLAFRRRNRVKFLP